MTQESQRWRARRVVLAAVLVLAVVVLGVAVAVTVPILTHSSAGESGQVLPETYETEVDAVGDDGRMRTLAVSLADGGDIDPEQLKPGQRIEVTGTGFDARIGIYVAICAIPPAGQRPTPCLGGAQADASEDPQAMPSAWLTNDWAWRAFATQGYDDRETGSFAVTLTVPEAAGEGLDCRVEACAIATRADHTAIGDRVQDMLLPVEFASA